MAGAAPAPGRPRAAFRAARPTTCHMTFLARDGQGKAPLQKERLFPSGLWLAGGGVWFWCDRPGGRGDRRRGHREHPQRYAPRWRSSRRRGPAGRLASRRIRPLPEARQVRIFADRDELQQGFAAAAIASRRWRAEGRDLLMSQAATPGWDADDVLVSRLTSKPDEAAPVADDIVNLPVDPSNGSAGSPGRERRCGRQRGRRGAVAVVQSPHGGGSGARTRRRYGRDRAFGQSRRAASQRDPGRFLAQGNPHGDRDGPQDPAQYVEVSRGEIAKRERRRGRRARTNRSRWAAGAAKARPQYKQRMFASRRHIAEDPAPAPPDGGGRARARRSARSRKIRQIFPPASLASSTASYGPAPDGAPLSGKNLVVEKVLMLFPEEEVSAFSGASPKALADFGGLDPDSLKGKVFTFRKPRS